MKRTDRSELTVAAATRRVFTVVPLAFLILMTTPAVGLSPAGSVMRYLSFATLPFLTLTLRSAAVPGLVEARTGAAALAAAAPVFRRHLPADSPAAG